MNKNYEALFTIKGKTIALIGATGILGSEYVDLLAKSGANLVIGDIDIVNCERLAKKVKNDYGTECISVKVDITKEDQISKFYNKLHANFDALDVLINNAQVKPDNFYAPFEKYTKKTLMEVLDGNLAGVIISSQFACKKFLEQGFGNIINVSSIYGNVGADQRLYEGVKNIYYPDEVFSSPVSYAVSKAGIINFTRYLASYYREKNIRVNCLTPGGVYDNHDSIFLQNYSARTLLGRMADKTDYNGAILFLASEASSYMTGANILIDGGWTAI
jgi:NAD(P)-dependent dehydrogenase (short-subunit alcohol dehydrogenase family)